MQTEGKGKTKSMSRLSTQSTGPRRSGLSHLNSSGDSSNNSSKDESNGSSRESTAEYTDSSGIDLHEFIISTLKTKNRFLLLSIERELLSLIDDSSRSSYTFGPYNAYERMLIHRVAAYFGFEHNLSEQSCVCVSKTPTTRIPDLKFDEVEGYNENAYLEKQHSLKLLKRNDCQSQSLESPDRRIQNGKYNSQRSKSYEERQKNYDATRDRIFAKDEGRNTGSTAIKMTQNTANDRARPQVGSGDGPRVIHKPTISVSDSDDTEAITADSSLKQSSQDSVDSSSTTNVKTTDTVPVVAPKKQLLQQKAIDEPESQSDGLNDSNLSPSTDVSPSITPSVDASCPVVSSSSVNTVTTVGSATTLVTTPSNAVSTAITTIAPVSTNSTCPVTVVQGKGSTSATYSQRNFSSNQPTPQSNYRWHQSHTNYTGQQHHYHSHTDYNSHHQQSHHPQHQQQPQYQTGNLQTPESFVNYSSYYNRNKGHHRKSQPPQSPIHNNGAIYVGQQGPMANFQPVPGSVGQANTLQAQATQSIATGVQMAQAPAMSHLLWPFIHDPSRQLTTPIIYNPYAVPPNDFSVDPSGMPVTFLPPPQTINSQSKDVTTNITPQLPPGNQTIIMQSAPTATITGDQVCLSSSCRPSSSAVSPPNAQSSVPLNCLQTAQSNNTTTLQQAQSPNGQNLYYINTLPQAMQMMPTTAGPFVLLSTRQNQMVTPQGFQVATNQGLLPLPPTYSPYIATTPSQFAHYPSMQLGQPMTVSQATVTASRPSPPPTGSYSTANVNPQQQTPQGQNVSYFPQPPPPPPPQQFTHQYYPFRSPSYIFTGGPNSNANNGAHSHSHRRPNNRNHNGNAGGHVNSQLSIANTNAVGLSNGQR